MKCATCGKEKVYDAIAAISWCFTRRCTDDPYTYITTPKENTNNNWIDEERRFLKKCTMVYEAYLEETNPNYEEAKDGIADAILTHWTTSDDGWQNARNIVTKWLKPTLKKLKKERNKHA